METRKANVTDKLSASGGMLHPDLRDLLHEVQNRHLFNDSKTEVDLPLKYDMEQVATNFQQLVAKGNVSDQELRDFVRDNLGQAGGDLTNCSDTSDQWVPEPEGFLPIIQSNTNTRQFALEVYGIWRELCRSVVPSVHQHPERHSLLPIEHDTVVPGDRFRETYYWDSYWVIRGLLVSNMTGYARNLVDNLAFLLREVGHVPNGARVYYLNRSQPPLLSAMIRQLFMVTNDTSLLHNTLPLLVKEHQYWTSGNKAVKVRDEEGNQHLLSRYWANWYSPRPESAREDMALAEEVVGSSVRDDPKARALYHELASGAESGWDFSSRWFADGKTLGTIRTTKVVPADLNAWLYQMERNIAWAANLTGDAPTSQQFNDLAAARKLAIMSVLWNDTAHNWHDCVLEGAEDSGRTSPVEVVLSGSGALASEVDPDHDAGTTKVYRCVPSNMTLASNYVPLWTGLLEGEPETAVLVVRSLNGSGLIQPSGIATTMYRTGQQWDFPNGWPPLQHMIIEGLDRYGGPEGKELATSLADRWVRANYAMFKETGQMHEKYDVTLAGGVGGGGEYSPQVGFGWSNGVLLDLLNQYQVYV